METVVIRLTLEEHTPNAVVSDNGYDITNSKQVMGCVTWKCERKE